MKSNSPSQEFRLGCAVWSYRGWLGNFYPPGSQGKNFLQLYGDRLHAVEGNTTFYAVPAAETVQRWREQTPPEFRFCLKFPQAVTHKGPLMAHLGEAQAFIERVASLGDRLGCIFAQLPPYYSPKYLDDLQAFLLTLTAAEIPLGVEVRHRDWFQAPHHAALNAVLSQHDITRVLLDTRPIYNCIDDPQAHSQRRKPQLPLIPVVTNGKAIVRFISHPHRPSNQPYFEQWCQQIQQWYSAGHSIYFFMHCPIEDHSPDHALYFQTMLQQTNCPVPPLPWQVSREVNPGAIAPVPEQLSLF
ncbi:DUF72 domain-containing protein [Picosynechococcus sp. NKBG15041c]|uniref:DUF72 domain-containing protein n=1 Tax=Picosynechococcus sp. NKBG15041c TaxID=1407650 RepID=UPI0003F8EE13|nr:DUF72 domain-containing protein [Picosynechococcus sp. NKBG15041c]